jgi:hypothetical protein
MIAVDAGSCVAEEHYAQAISERNHVAATQAVDSSLPLLSAEPFSVCGSSSHRFSSSQLNSSCARSRGRERSNAWSAASGRPLRNNHLGDSEMKKLPATKRMPWRKRSPEDASPRLVLELKEAVRISHSLHRVGLVAVVHADQRGADDAKASAATGRSPCLFRAHLETRDTPRDRAGR